MYMNLAKVIKVIWQKAASLRNASVTTELAVAAFDKQHAVPSSEKTAVLTGVHVSPLKVPRLSVKDLTVTYTQWRRQDFVTGGKVRYGSIGGLEYEVPQSRLYCLCINVALCSTALQCICRVIRRSSMTMKAHTYYIIF